MNNKLLATTAITALLATQFANAELVISQNGETQKVGEAAAQPAAVTKAPKTAKVEKVKPSNSTSYKLDPNHANVRFAIDHFGTTTNTGGFYGLTGDMEYNPAKRMGSINVDIPVNSLNTGSEAFDKHLKSGDFFDAEKYPTANFKSTKFHFKNGKVTKVDGNLTLLGKTNPVSLKATKFNCYNSPMLKNAQVCGGDFETTIDRTKWGMDTYVKMGFAKDVKLNIQVEAVQQ